MKATNNVSSWFASLLLILMFVCGSALANSISLAPGSSVAVNYTSTFGSAGSAKALFSLNASGNQLTITFQNTSTSNTYLTGLSFNTSPDISVTSHSFASLPSGSTWSFSSSGGGGMGNFETTTYGNGNKNRLKPGQSGTIVLNLGQAFPNGLTLDVTLVHLTSLPNGSSQKPIGVVTNSKPGGYVGSVTNPVPEPATLLLLGSGLLLGGSRLRMRNHNRTAEAKPSVEQC